MLNFGVAYPAELFTAEETRAHARLMQKARITLARVGERAWAQFEPESGHYRLDALEAALKILKEASIDVLLTPPVNVPPPWVFQRHPHLLRRYADGREATLFDLAPCCLNAPDYVIFAQQIARELAKRFHAAETIAGWYLPAAASARRCYCAHCEKAFRAWLLERYGDTAALNETWGTAYDGVIFHAWNEIPLPAPAGRSNPGHALDFARFTSESWATFHKKLRAILREYPGELPVTIEIPRFGAEADPAALIEDADIFAEAPGPGATDGVAAAMNHAYLRALKRRSFLAGQDFCAADAAGVVAPVIAGETRLQAWQAIANGANGVCYAEWRTVVAGARRGQPGLLDADGTPGRRFKEARKTGQELVELSEWALHTRVRAKVALLYSPECAWNGDDAYLAELRACFENIYRRKLGCDVIGPASDLAGYRAVIAPALGIADEALVARLEAFVRDGGNLALTARSGLYAQNGALALERAPGVWTKLVGASVAETRIQRPGQTQVVTFARGRLIARDVRIGGWAEALDCDAAQSIVEYRTPSIAGKAAVTRHDLDKGRVFYFGVTLEAEALDAVLDEVLPEPPVKDLPPHVEASVRTDGKDRRILFLLNHCPGRSELRLEKPRRDVLTHAQTGPVLHLSPHGALGLEF